LQCDQGKYTSKTASTACYSCSSGKYLETFGSNSETSCKYCHEGTYNNQTDASYCEVCPKGTYASSIGHDLCIPCSKNSYTSSYSKTSCENCATGKFTLFQGSSSCQYCESGKIYTDPQDIICKQCPEGTFAPFDGATQCHICKTNQYCIDGIHYDCPPESNSLPNYSDGEMCTIENQLHKCTHTCQNNTCPSGEVNIWWEYHYGEGLSYYEVDKYVPPPAVSMAIKMNWLGGTLSWNGARSCNISVWYENNENKMILLKSYDCPGSIRQYIGEWIYAPPPTRHMKITYEKRGEAEGFKAEYASIYERGARSPLDCKCSDPRKAIQNLTHPICDCKKGLLRDPFNESQCTLCIQGKFGSETMNCLDCSSGTYNTMNGASSCQQCIQGTYFTGTGALHCTLCEKGKYNSIKGSTYCQECGHGTYNSGNGKETCDKCLAGKYSSQTNATSEESCSYCNVSIISSIDGSTSCTKCASGMYASSKGLSSCSFCPEKRYCPQGDSYACPYGSTSNKIFSDGEFCTVQNQSSCSQGCAQEACPSGKISVSYSNDDLIYVLSYIYIRAHPMSHTLAIKIHEAHYPHMLFSYEEPTGTWNLVRTLSVTIGSHSELTIYPNEWYLFPNMKHIRISYSRREKYAIGYKGEYASFFHRGAAFPEECDCDKGFTGTHGLLCNRCEAGTFKSDIGNATCTACSEGKYTSNSSNSDCYACEVGKYNPFVNMTFCLQCPSNSSSPQNSADIKKLQM